MNYGYIFTLARKRIQRRLPRRRSVAWQQSPMGLELRFAIQFPANVAIGQVEVVPDDRLVSGEQLEHYLNHRRSRIGEGAAADIKFITATR